MRESTDPQEANRRGCIAFAVAFVILIAIIVVLVTASREKPISSNAVIAPTNQK